MAAEMEMNVLIEGRKEERKDGRQKGWKKEGRKLWRKEEECDEGRGKDRWKKEWRMDGIEEGMEKRKREDVRVNGIMYDQYKQGWEGMCREEEEDCESHRV